LSVSLYFSNSKTEANARQIDSFLFSTLYDEAKMESPPLAKHLMKNVLGWVVLTSLPAGK